MKKTIVLFCSIALFVNTFAQNEAIVLQEGFIGTVTQIRYSPDGQFLANCATEDYSVQIWDVNTRKTLGKLHGHTKDINSIKFSSDGNFLLSGSEDNKTILWDINTMQAIHTFEGHTKAVKDVCFNSKNNLMTNASEDGKLDIWNVTDKLMLKSITIGSKLLFTAISPDDKFIVCINEDSELFIYDLTTYSQTGKFKIHKKGVTACEFMGNKNILITSSADNTIKLWNIPDGTLQSTITCTSEPACISYNSNKNRLLAGSRNGSINLYNMADLSLFWSIISTEGGEEEGDKTVRAISFNPTGLTFATSGFRKNVLGKYVSQGNVINIWNVEQKLVVSVIKGSVFPIHTMASDPNNNILASMCMERIFFWDLNKAELLFTYQFEKGVTQKKQVGAILNKMSSITEGAKNTYVLRFSPDGKYLLAKTPDDNFSVLVFEVLVAEKKLNFIRKIRSEYNAPLNEVATNLNALKESKQFPINDFCLSPDNSKLVIGSTGNPAIIVFDFATGTLTHQVDALTAKNTAVTALNAFDAGKDKVNSCTFNHSGAFLAASFNSGAVIVYETVSWYQSCKLFDNDLTSYFFYGRGFLDFSKDDNKLYFNKGNDLYIISDYGYSSATFKKVNQNFATFFVNGESTYVGAKKNSVCLNINGQIKTIAAHSDDITAMMPLSDKLFASAGKDGKIKLWDPMSGTELLTIVSSDGNDYIFLSPENYYKVSKDGLDLIAFRKDRKIFPLEQFDIKFNRPDFVLGKLPDSNPTMVQLYKKAYEKRLKKSGFTENMLGSDWHLPVLSVVNKEAVAIQTMARTITLEFSATDTKYPLDRINVWVNGVPVYGINGISIKDKKTMNYQMKCDIVLSSGLNKIQASVINSKGVESIRDEFMMNYKGPADKPSLYFVGISVSNYKDSRWNLKYAAKDGRDMTTFFRQATTQYANVFIDTLFNQAANITNLKKVKADLLKSKEDDQVIVFISGHGLLDNNLDFYYASYDVDFDNPAINGIPYDMLEALLDSIPARKKLLLIDACHSGEIDKDEVFETETTTLSDDISFRGVPSTKPVINDPEKNKKSVGIENSFEMMQELFTDFNKGSGAIVISAAAGKGYALESDQWNNGVFTYSILNGIKNAVADKNKDGIIQVSELREYVGEEVQKLTKGKQKPTTRNENLDNDFTVWKK